MEEPSSRRDRAREETGRSDYPARVLRALLEALSDLDLPFGPVQRVVYWGRWDAVHVILIPALPGPAASAAIASLHAQITRAGRRIVGISLGADERSRWEAELRDWRPLVAVAEAAYSRDIPVRFAWYDRLPALHLGYGRFRRTVMGPVWPNDSALTLFIGTRKALAREVLRETGAPIPDGAAVTSLREAAAVAEKVGFPVVLKDELSSNSYGVVTGIQDGRGLKAAFRHLSRGASSRRFVLEKMLSGRYFRAMIVDGRCVRISQGAPIRIRGDGKRSILEIVRSEHPGLETGAYRRHRLRGILLGQGLSLRDVPRLGLEVEISPPTANWRDCTTDVHPLNRELLEMVGRNIGQGIVGVDIVCSDIRRRWRSGRDGIVEVNGAPGTAFHSDQASIASLLLDRLFPPGAASRIPIVCFAGRGAHRLASQAERESIGRSEPGEGSRGPPRDAIGDGWASLSDPETARAFTPLSLSQAMEDGIPFDRCDALVLSASIPRPFESILLERVRAGGSVIINEAAGLSPAGFKALQQRRISLIVARRRRPRVSRPTRQSS